MPVTIALEVLLVVIQMTVDNIMRKQTSSSQRSEECIVTVYNQIDYILCMEKIKHTLINARGFNGTETSKDHCLVICKLQVENITSSTSHSTFQLITTYNITPWLIIEM